MNYKKIVLILLLSNATGMLQAQVPVVEEPRHKKVLENDYVRLLDVHLAPGDTSLYHIHATPSVIVFLSQSVMGAEVMAGQSQLPARVYPQQVLYMDYAAKPVTHRVYNDSSNVFHVMDIELVKTSASPDACTLLQQQNLTTAIEEQLVNVYKLDIEPNQSLTIPAGHCAYLLICIAGEIETTKKMAAGDFLFFTPGNKIPLINKQNTKASFVLLALK
jgi:predicted component of type VI protein secretion system